MGPHNQLVTNLLSSSNGFVVGEVHSERAGIQFITDSLDDLKSQGVNRIFTEYTLDENATLDEKLLTALSVDIANVYVNQNGIPPQLANYVSTLAIALYTNDQSKMDFVKNTFYDDIAEIKRKTPAFQAMSDELIYNFVVSSAKAGLASETAENQYNHFNLIKKAHALGIEE